MTAAETVKKRTQSAGETSEPVELRRIAIDDVETPALWGCLNARPDDAWQAFRSDVAGMAAPIEVIANTTLFHFYIARGDAMRVHFADFAPVIQEMKGQP